MWFARHLPGLPGYLPEARERLLAPASDIHEQEPEAPMRTRVSVRVGRWLGRWRVEQPAAQEQSMQLEREHVLRAGIDLREMTPEETRAIRRAGQKLVNQEAEFDILLAKLIATAASGVRIK